MNDAECEFIANVILDAAQDWLTQNSEPSTLRLLEQVTLTQRDGAVDVTPIVVAAVIAVASAIDVDQQESGEIIRQRIAGARRYLGAVVT